MSLKDGAQYNVTTRREWLAQAERAAALVDRLPAEMQELEGAVDMDYSLTKLRVSLYRHANEGVDLLRVCKMAGVQGLQTKMFTPDNWFANGTMRMDEVEVQVYIGGLPKPPACRIEPYEETVTKYRAICEETGEEIV